MSSKVNQAQGQSGASGQSLNGDVESTSTTNSFGVVSAHRDGTINLTTTEGNAFSEAVNAFSDVVQFGRDALTSSQAMQATVFDKATAAAAAPFKEAAAVANSDMGQIMRWLIVGAVGVFAFAVLKK